MSWILINDNPMSIDLRQGGLGCMSGTLGLSQEPKIHALQIIGLKNKAGILILFEFEILG